MKTIKRTLRKGNSKPASPQVPNQPKIEAKAVSIILFEGSQDNRDEEMDYISGLDYSAAEYAEIRRSAAQNKQSLPDFLEQAIKHQLELNAAGAVTQAASPQVSERTETRRYPQIELEDAVRASAALTALLCSHIAHPEAEIYTAGITADTFNCGLMLVCNQTNDRLLEVL